MVSGCWDAVTALSARFLPRPPELQSPQLPGLQGSSSSSSACPVIVTGRGSHPEPEHVRDQVNNMILAEVHVLKDCLAKELEGAISRLAKQQAHSRKKKERQLPDPEDDSRESQGQDVAVRPNRRRWTAAGDGSEGLHAILRRQVEACDDLEGRSCATSTVGTSPCTTPPSSCAPSICGSKVVRICFERHREEVEQEESEEDAEVEEPHEVQKRRVSGSSDQSVHSHHSSLAWRADALDFGDRLAAAAAAKKGSLSFDSIVELVQAEQERWADEKNALEARLEELKAQLREQQVRRNPDPEKEALRKQCVNLQKVMKARSRFGAWVCEKHMQESDDEDCDQVKQDEKEELRKQLSELGSKLRAAQCQAGREPPGPIRGALRSTAHGPSPRAVAFQGAEA